MRTEKTIITSLLILSLLLSILGCKSAGIDLGKAVKKAKDEITNGATDQAKKTINGEISNVKKKFSASANSCEELDEFLAGLNENGGIDGLKDLSTSARGAGLSTEADEIDDLIKQLNERYCECHPKDPICPDNDGDSDPVYQSRSSANLELR